MGNPIFEPLKKFARTIRYHPLPEFIGQQVVIHRLDSIEADIQKRFEGSIFDNCPLIDKDERFTKAAIAKYGILDVAFNAPSDLLESDFQTGIKTLKSLRLVTPPREIKEIKVYPEDLEEYAELLQIYLDEIAEDKTYLLVFMKTAVSGDVKARMQMIEKISDSDFPKEFIVEDVAVTNFKSAWLRKHFYW